MTGGGGTLALFYYDGLKSSFLVKTMGWPKSMEKAAVETGGNVLISFPAKQNEVKELSSSRTKIGDQNLKEDSKDAK